MSKPKSKGFIVLPRELQDHPYYNSEPYTKMQAFIDLIFLANYKPSHYIHCGKVVKVGIGQVSIAQETMARKWRWSRNRVIRFLRGLETIHAIAQDKTGITNLITILNYSDYVLGGTKVGTYNGTKVGTNLGTHPKESKEKKESAVAIPAGNGFAPIKKISP